jgi:DNA-binding transcriptional regulator YiaG
MGAKTAKRMQKMTPLELKTARKKIGLNQTQMAKQLRTPRNTYLNWERGRRPVTGTCETAMELLLWRDALVMQAITEKIAQSFPGTGTR